LLHGQLDELLRRLCAKTASIITGKLEDTEKGFDGWGTRKR